METMDDPQPKPSQVRAILERLEGLAETDTPTLGALIQGVGTTSFVPVMMVPALLVFSPLSGIPFLPTICGLLIALIAFQLVVRRKHLWLPEVLMRRHLNGARLGKALHWLEGAADWLDRRSRKRFAALTADPLVILPQIACIFCGLAMPFLELVPFSSSILAAAVLFFSVSFLVRDGLFVILGWTLMGLASLIPINLYGLGFG